MNPKHQVKDTMKNNDKKKVMIMIHPIMTLIDSIFSYGI